MERKTRIKILAILMIISVLAADFLIIGSNLMTYATKQFNKETSNSNIEFSAYFKNGEERIETIQKNIKTEDLKLYAEIKVKSEGYLKEGTVIEIENSNFELKNDILVSNKYVKNISGNKVTLKQIDNGNAIEIELGIKPKIVETIKTDYLASASTVKMIATYVYSEAENGESVQAEKLVCVNYQPDEETQAELVTDIITNKVFSVNSTNQRIIQLLLKSRLPENEYTVKQTKLNVSIPQLGETTPDVIVTALGDLATNGLKQISKENYEIVDNKLQITIKNEPNENNQINWKKDLYDELVVTYIYPEDVDASQIIINAESQILVYNSENVYEASNTATETKELNNIIIGRTEIITEEIYKGQLYANAVAKENIDIEYETKTTLAITQKDVVEKITINEGLDVFDTEETQFVANTEYVITKFNLGRMLEILGQDGTIEIKNAEATTLINKDTTIDEEGNVILKHNKGVSKIEITTSNPVEAGILEIYHTKLITKNDYNRTELEKVKTLNAKGTVTGTKLVNEEEQKIVENSTETMEARVELKETTTKAELKIDKFILSTTEQNELTVGIKLSTDNTKYDLFKNPSILLQMPSAVENVKILETPTKLYDNANELKEINARYDVQNKAIVLDIEGEQTVYPTSSVYIQLKLNIELSKFAISQTDKIVMGYKNENASQYEGGTIEYGIVEKGIQISAPSQLIKQFNLSSNENNELTETILYQLQNKDFGKTLNFEIGLTNNKDAVINNVKILGKLPTAGNTATGEDENSLETILENIKTENATIYYTENEDATEDVENSENQWTTDLSTLTNAKLFLIKKDSIQRGEKYIATVAVKIPNTIGETDLSYAQYQVIYDIANEKNVKEDSRKIGIAPSLAASIKTEITAQVGQISLNTGDIVKEGEVLKYTVTLKNKGTQNLQNVKLKINMPEGTTYIKPIEGKYTLKDGTVIEDGYVYVPDAYYEEITDAENLKKYTEITIPELAKTEPYIMQYEVRINKGNAGKTITNCPTIIFDNIKLNTIEFKNIVEESNVRATIKRTKDVTNPSLPGSSNEYIVYIENLSNTTINNLRMQINSDTFNVERIEDINGIIPFEENIKISKIEPNSMIYFNLYGHIAENATKVDTSIVINDEQGKKYRSNAFEEKISQINATINQTSPQEGQEIKQDDLIQYHITVKNTGEIESAVIIKDVIPNYMSVQGIKVTQNGENTIKQCIDTTNKETYVETIINEVAEVATLKPGETVEMDIAAKVKNISNIDNGKTINNTAIVEILNVKEIQSQTISHILKANEEQEETTGNSISGLIWTDENENGLKEKEENVISNIILKLYNITSKDYLTDSNGNIVQSKTNNKGEYNFTDIEKGLYLIIIEGKYEPTENSKANSKVININGKEITVIVVEINELKENLSNINIGLKEKTDELPVEEKNEISGTAWLDADMDGQKDENEENLTGIKVKIYDVSTKNYLTDENGKIIEIATNENGKYKISNIEKGSYILVFEYDTENYKPTTFMAEGVENAQNSKVILNNLNINGKEEIVAVTDTINVDGNVTDINIGLKEILTFDLELNKYISKMMVQTNKETKEYNYEDSLLGKVEIHKNQIEGALVVLEYTIKIKNNGEISGYTKNIVDYLPNGLTFSSELNKDWYLSGNYLYTKALENIEIKPGEEKEVKLVLTKTMTGDNVGLINNRAEIEQDYNKYGEPDIDSTPNNQVQEEDDFGSVDVIVQIATGGGTSYIVLILINIALIGIAIKIMVNNGIIIITTKEERR